MKKRTFLIILGNLTAFGPFVTDFYLPCLPELTETFSSSASAVQVSLTAGMFGLAAGQLLIGPLADKYGRRRPLLWCLMLFVLATIGCILSTDIRPFVLFRLMQGLTGASGLVISKAVVADMFSGRKLARYLAFLASIQGAAPIVAPVVGGLAFSLSSWQGAFVALCVWGACLGLACRRMEETLPEGKRLQMPVWKSFRCYVPVIGNHRYMVMNLLLGFSSAALMAYISASPFIFQNLFGLTPLQYSVCFSCNAVGLVMGSAAVMRTKDLHSAVRFSCMILLVTSIGTSLALLQGWAFLLFEAALFLMLFSVGMITPVATTLALDTVNENKGVASALLGAMPYFLGGIVAPLTGLGNMLCSTVTLILLCSVVCFCLYLLSRKMRQRDFGQ